MSLEELIRVGAGRVVEHAPLGAQTTYRVGGRARVLVTLSSMSDLEELGHLLFETGLPLFVIGNGSNLLVADGEHDIVAVRLQGTFCDLTWGVSDPDVSVYAGAGLDLPVAARRLSGEGIVGFEWAVGVPGTFGGAVVMNAGGHGSDMASSVTSVSTFGPSGTGTLAASSLKFAYRSSTLDGSLIVTGVNLTLPRGDAEDAKTRVAEIVRWRREHQPGGHNAGSVFQNPDGDFAGRLIEAAHCKGLAYGSAHVSDKHANFVLVDSNGSANDVFTLITMMRERVYEAFGVRLESEHRFLGFESA